MPIVVLQAVQFHGSLQVHVRGMEGSLQDMTDLGGSEALLARLA